MNKAEQEKCVLEMMDTLIEMLGSDIREKREFKDVKLGYIEKMKAIIAAHDKQPSGEPEYIEINPRLPGKKTAWNKQLLDGINSGKSVAVMLPKEKLEKMLNVKLPKTGVLIFNNALTRDPGKVEAVIEAAERVVDGLGGANIYPEGIERKVINLTKALADTLKGMSDGS